MSLAYTDQAFQSCEITPRVVVTLGVRNGMGYQLIPWRTDVLDKPIFTPDWPPDPKLWSGLDVTALYQKFNPWVKRLGEATGFVQPLSYLERRQLLERAL